MYNKQGSVLRVETTINRARRFRVCRTFQQRGRRYSRWVPPRKGGVDFRRRKEICLAANRRYPEALRFAVIVQPLSRVLDPVSLPRTVEQKRYRALRPISPEESEKPALLQDGRFSLEGFRNRDLQNQWPDPVADDPQEKRRTARLTRWLRLRRAHRMIAKLPRTHSYRLTRKGRAVITSAVTARKANVSALAA